MTPTDSLNDRLEPFWDEVDGCVQRVRDLAPDTPTLRHLEASAHSLRAMWYLRSRIEQLDADYGQLVDDARATGRYSAMFTIARPDGSRLYFPFFEALEFEHLLSAGKTCSESFCLGVGSLFRNRPHRPAGLVSVLEAARRKEPRAGKLIRPTRDAERKLRGLIIDPDHPKKKSLRDLTQHWERAPIHFRLDTDGRSVGALVDMDHPQLVRLQNYRVTYVSDLLWHSLQELLSICLPELVTLLQERQARPRGA